MYNFKYNNLMKDLFIGALAVAVGIYVEKKYKVCDKIAEQAKNFTGKDLFDMDDEEQQVEVD